MERRSEYSVIAHCSFSLSAVICAAVVALLLVSSCGRRKDEKSIVSTPQDQKFSLPEKSGVMFPAQSAEVPEGAARSTDPPADAARSEEAHETALGATDQARKLAVAQKEALKSHPEISRLHAEIAREQRLLAWTLDTLPEVMSKGRERVELAEKFRELASRRQLLVEQEGESAGSEDLSALDAEVEAARQALVAASQELDELRRRARRENDKVLAAAAALKAKRRRLDGMLLALAAADEQSRGKGDDEGAALEHSEFAK